MPAEKPQTIIGLYLNLAEHAIVLCADENSRIQALDRPPPGLLLKLGRNGTAPVIGLCDEVPKRDQRRHAGRQRTSPGRG